MTRPLSSLELVALGTYLPEDLTEEQLSQTLKAVEHACERAWEEGMDRTANLALIRRQHIIREDQTND